MSEVREFLERHLASIFASDLATYHATTAEDLTIYDGYRSRSLHTDGNFGPVYG
jgi:hypothetical protein